ncbi:MAG: hypothetical protein RI967_858 [Planctomycetota bacterium]
MTTPATILALAATELPGGFAIGADMSPWLQAALLMLGTFVLEDTTAIAAGLLAHAGTVPLSVAIVGTGVGIFLGDLGLYLLGALAARGAHGTGWIRRRLPERQLDRVRGWFAGGTWKAILLSRILSGTRLPVYLGAGFVGAGFGRFALWTFVAVLVWTPLVVGGTAWIGGSVLAAAERAIGPHWSVWIVALAALVVAVAILRRAWTRRRGWRIAFERAQRFEFWPNWAIYGPLAPFYLVQSARHGGLRSLTAANPCWPDGGMVGESKQAGLDAFDPAFVAPSFLVEVDGERIGSEAIEAACARLASEGWHAPDDSGTWTRPVVVKPDAGQRGFGVRIARSEPAFREALAASRADMVVQRHAAGEIEVGLFVIRRPGRPPELLSIGEKRLPHATGDGRTPLGELIRRDPRLRLQEHVFLERHAHELDRVLAEGERLRLSHAANHSQGCLFLSGEHLRTPALEAWALAAMTGARGFDYGRLDVVFPDADACRRGVGGAILEANGVLSESIDMYDPALGAFGAWRIMRRHWSIAFEIGRANRTAGARGMGVREFLGRWRAWRRRADGSIAR